LIKVTTFSPVTLIFLAVFFLGLAHIAFLPPFEGFDETAHLSYVEQVADTGTWPRLERDQLSREVESYMGPQPYGMTFSPERTYWAFLATGQPVPSAGPHHYEPGRSLNWEAQHPPLYYLALAPFYKLAQGWDWKSLLLLLRTVSWVMAFTGFAVGAYATLQVLSDVPPPARLMVLGLPLLFPEFFPEMARLGNDSLCLLIMGVAWWILLRLLKQRDLPTAVFLGLLLGVGLWTKAFFVPIGNGVVLFLAFIAVRDRDVRLLRCAVVTAGVTAVSGCGWYVDGFLSTGGFDFMQADKAPNFWHLPLQALDLEVFLRGLLTLASSFVWSGTWSFATFSHIYSVPVLVFLALMFSGWIMRLRRGDAVLIAPAFIALPVVLGILAWLTQMTLSGARNEGPGWYLHILSGPLALAFASGWRWPYILSRLSVYALLFHVACWLGQLSIFSGCTYRDVGQQFQIGDCFLSFPHLAVLGWPVLGLIAFADAAISLAFGFYSYRAAPKAFS
jgi:hypothetical protein